MIAVVSEEAVHIGGLVFVLIILLACVLIMFWDAFAESDEDDYHDRW